jgi:hypothetical protein
MQIGIFQTSGKGNSKLNKKVNDMDYQLKSAILNSFSSTIMN